MRKLLSKLASLELTVVLIVLIGLVLSAGTILESLRGAEAAKGVYEAPWFYALQGLLALNAICALVDRWPRNRWRIGFAVTHLSILLILARRRHDHVLQAGGTARRSRKARSRQSSSASLKGGATPAIRLPFAIRLDAFEIDVYPGTNRPAMFRSRVQVVDARPRRRGCRP